MVLLGWKAAICGTAFSSKDTTLRVLVALGRGHLLLRSVSRPTMFGGRRSAGVEWRWSLCLGRQGRAGGLGQVGAFVLEFLS